MLGHWHRSRMGGCLLLGLALFCPTSGCGVGGASESKPAEFSPEVQKKNQDLMSGGYRDQIVAAHKAQASSKKAAAKSGH
jgi:hypothetical protein